MTSKYRLHHVRFYNPDVHAIRSMAFCDAKRKLALSRADNSVEIWSFQDAFLYHEKTILPVAAYSIESLVWCQERLFSVGLTGVIVEYDLLNLKFKNIVPISFGATWCIAKNYQDTHLAVGTEDGFVSLFFVSESSVEYEKTLDKQNGRVMCLSWHKSGDFLVTGSNSSVILWKVSSGNAVQTMKICDSDKIESFAIFCVAITSDFTIISGDTHGDLIFWNGTDGVFVQKYHFKNSVLSLVLNQRESTIWASGIDSHCIKFNLVKNGESSHWFKSVFLTHHTHDVRALILADDYLISGGVDTLLCVNKFPPKIDYRVPSFSRRYCVQVAKSANFLLLQYHSSLALWQLGSTKKNSEIDNTKLALSKLQLKLVELKARDGESVACSAVSDDGKWLAYSSSKSLRLFRVIVDNEDAEIPRVSVVRVRQLPGDCCRSCCCMSFNSDGTKLISLQPCGELQVIGVDTEKPQLLHSFREDENQRSNSGYHLLCLSGDDKFAAIGSHSSQIVVYDLDARQVCCILPRHVCQPSIISFVPDSSSIIVAYQDRQVHIFDLKMLKYTLRRPVCLPGAYPLLGVTFVPGNPSPIFYDDQTIHVVKLQLRPYVKTMHRFDHLVYLSSVKEDFLVAVDVPHLSLISKLPPQMKRKKFGI